MLHRVSIAAFLMVVAAVANGQETELTSANFERWRDHILPCDGELGWQKIPWLTTFADGIQAANDADKPLLLWTMNGHPLGCT